MPRTRNVGRRAIAIGYTLVGFALATFALAMVWTFGEGLGASPFERIVYGGAHVSLHLFGTLSAFAIGFFLVDKSKLWATLATVAVVLCGAYGIANMIGFAGKNRLGVADALAENSARELRKYEADRMDLISRRDWAAGQSMSFGNSKVGRANFKKQEAEYQARIDALQPPKVNAGTVHADGQATILARVTNTSAENWQLALTIPIAILLFIGEMLSFIFAVRIWPARPVEIAPRAAANDDDPALPDLIVPKARVAQPLAHVAATLSALQDIGLTGDVPYWQITKHYPNIARANGIEPLANATFLEALAESCQRKRAWGPGADGVRARVTVYEIPERTEAAPEAEASRPARASNLASLPKRPEITETLAVLGRGLRNPGRVPVRGQEGALPIAA